MKIKELNAIKRKHNRLLKEGQDKCGHRNTFFVCYPRIVVVE